MEAEVHSGADAPARRNNSMAGERGKRSTKQKLRGNKGPRHGEFREGNGIEFPPKSVFVEK